MRLTGPDYVEEGSGEVEYEVRVLAGSALQYSITVLVETALNSSDNCECICNRYVAPYRHQDKGTTAFSDLKALGCSMAGSRGVRGSQDPPPPPQQHSYIQIQRKSKPWGRLCLF